MRRPAQLLVFFLIGAIFTPILNSAWGATPKKISCPPDGDHYLIDIKQLALEYKGDSLQVTLGGLAVLGGRLKVEPKTLQTAAAATQQWNEFLKGLATGYNSCAITKAQYQEGFKRICLQLFRDGDELEKLRKAFLEGRKLDEKKLQKLLDGYLANMKKFASLSDQEIIIDRISAVVEHAIKSTEEKILTAQTESEKRIIVSQRNDSEVILKKLEEIGRRNRETPLGKPLEVQKEISAVKQSLLEKADEAETAYNEGYSLFDEYRFSEAIPHFRKALSLVKLADFYAALGRCYIERYDMFQAEKVLKEGLEFAATSGDERNEAMLANLLGGTLRNKGELDEALRYSERALKIDEKIYGPDHQNVARDVNTIGTILHAKNDIAGALRYTERALKIDEKIYGPDHPIVANLVSNIGLILVNAVVILDVGMPLRPSDRTLSLDLALFYAKRGLQINEKAYGTDDPVVANNALVIGRILNAKGDLDGALLYTERALKIGEKVYGPDHPKVAGCAINIGAILKDKGDLDGALRYTEFALKILEKSNGPDNPETIIARSNFDELIKAKNSLPL
jgi:tetratricopeptide (TPR) repeat protein